MIKIFFSLLLLLLSDIALANSSCDDIPGEQRYTPLEIVEGTVCFIEQPALDQQNNSVGVETMVYFITQGHDPIEAENGALPNDGGNSSGKIVDVFALDIDHDGKDEIVIIQFVEVRHSLAEPNSSEEFYDVIVFNQNGMTLSMNERISYWFGHGYSWHINGEKKIYEFPYLSRQSIHNSLSSPFISLMKHGEVVPVIVKRKSYLYEGPVLYGEPNKYLIAGDKATVDKHTAGWCRINYTGGRQPLQMWTMCDALEVDADEQ